MSEELKLGGAKDYSVGKIRDVSSLSLTKCESGIIMNSVEFRLDLSECPLKISANLVEKKGVRH